MPENKHSGTFVRMIRLMGKRIWAYALTVLIDSAVIGYLFNMALAFIEKDVMDAAMNGSQELLSRALIFAALIFFLGMPLLLGCGFLLGWFSKKTMTGVRVDLFQHITGLPISSFEDQHSGDLISRGTNDLTVIERTFNVLIPNLMLGFVLGIVGVVLILDLDWRLGVMALVLGIITTFMSLGLARPLRTRSEMVQKSLGSVTERLTDLLQGLPVTKMFHLEEKTHSLYKDANEQWSQASVKLARIQAVYDTFNYAIESLQTIGTLGLGLYLMTNGYTELGIITAAIHLQNNAGFLFLNLGKFITGIQKSLAGSERVFEVMARPLEPAHYGSGNRSLNENPSWDGVIVMRDLGFQYQNGGDNGSHLEQINITVGKGQMAALVGPSGGGKSTLIKLILGLYPIGSGSLEVNGAPIQSYTLEDLRRLIAYVPQDAYLFDGTIEENIGYGKPGAAKEEISAAAKAAYAYDFIMEQKDGFQTMVGERGVYLSGGQRQRIAIARALLKDAPILLLDEATSALDSESEQQVQQALERLMKGRTTIAVAHRLSTIRHADRIYVLDQGRVVQEGKHTELVERPGLYRTLSEMA
jgi:ABC-type multidrug transport system fused ATPase/permease subunit